MKLSIALVTVLALAACKDKGGDNAGGGDKGGGGGKVASCTLAKLGNCREYNENNLIAGADNLAKLCTALDKSAVFAMTACSTDKLVGTCTTPEAKDFYYPEYPVSGADLEKQCTGGIAHGTFARGK